MKYPSFDQYQLALQNPGNSFRDHNLMSGEVQLDLWGLPQVRSGGFALTYKIRTKHESIAVRCFHKDVADRSKRYLAICRYIAERENPYFVPISYQHKGIFVSKKYYPITVMKWVEGDTLESYINKNYRNKVLMEPLFHHFKEMVDQLKVLQIAHGDLSTQNILIHGSKLVLVDYDGMYLPSFAGLISNETGHANFQHPSRDFNWFNSRVDNFSAITIALSLYAIILHPDLWERFESSGEGFLFRKQDFLLPYQSPLLQEMETIAQLREYVYFFRKICHAPITSVPELSDFLEKRITSLPKDEIHIQSSHGENVSQSVSSSRRLTLMNNLGKIVTVVGQVTDVFDGKTRDGMNHIFLNFGNWKGRCFTAVIWDEAYYDLKRKGIDSMQFINKWISATGLLTCYKNRPQISFSSLIGFEVLQSAEEAEERLGGKSNMHQNTTSNELLNATSSPDLIHNKPMVDEPPENLISTSREIYEENINAIQGRIKTYNHKLQKKIDELYAGFSVTDEQQNKNK